jgi:hypothetical protein
MASMTDGFENALALLLFNNTAITDIGDAGGLRLTVAAGSTQLSLQTVALTDADTTMTTNEVAYTTYARPTQLRASGAGGWTVTGATADNASLIQFGEMTAGGPDTVVHLGLGFIATGSVLRLHQDLANDLVINNGVNPQFAVGALDWVFA